MPVFVSGATGFTGSLPHSVTVSVDWVFQWRESFRDGVYSVPGFRLFRREKVMRVSSGTVQTWKCADRRIPICGFKPTTESFMRASS
jgi:hypothetical protein